jgi:proline dehydrogenase
MLNKQEVQAVRALKTVARDEKVKSYIQESTELYPLFLRAAKRYIAGERREEAVYKAKKLLAKGHLVSLEYIGENMRNEEECLRAKEEFSALIKEVGANSSSSTISLDLSHIGLSVDKELAYQHLKQLINEAKTYDLTLMISMEESTKTTQILDIYKRSLEEHGLNLGITIQAHLNRSVQDIKDLIQYPGKIRLVKGAFQEPKEIAIPRSEELNKRYLMLLEQLIAGEKSVSVATHDKAIIQEIKKQGYLGCQDVEVEMLYGVQPELLKQLRDQNYKTRVYLTYGKEWYLYVCHRLAEYPPNIYQAITDITLPSFTEEGEVHD